MGRGSFVKVKCDGCGNEQTVFSKPSTTINCVVCDDVLADPKGGKGGFRSPVTETVV